MGAKTIFVKLRNNAYLCLLPENGAADFNLFSPKDAYLIFRQLQKRGYNRVLTGDAKNEILCPTGPPYALKC